MNVLIGCETSGVLRQAFRDRGHNAWSCDILPAQDGRHGVHIIGDALQVLQTKAWDLVVLHPPCTYLCSSGLHWNGRVPDRRAKTEDALTFALQCWAAAMHIPHVALENPIGCLSSRWRKPDQIIQPHWFGDDASKATCLWLKGLPPLVPTQHVPPRMVGGKPRWSNQTNSGQNKLGPTPDRWRLRSRTYPGVAAAMAEQWGGF